MSAEQTVAPAGAMPFRSQLGRSGTKLSIVIMLFLALWTLCSVSMESRFRSSFDAIREQSYADCHEGKPCIHRHADAHDAMDGLTKRTESAVLSFKAAVSEASSSSRPLPQNVVDNGGSVGVSDTKPNERMIFLIAMGNGTSATRIVERCVLSIRRRGKYDGHVALLTDAPRDRYQELLDSDAAFTVIQPRDEDYNWNTADNIVYKRFKTMILEYIDRDPKFQSVSLVYYLDIDIVVGADMARFFDHVERRYVFNGGEVEGTGIKPASPSGAIGALASRMYCFRGNIAYMPMQSGQFVLQRHQSQPCLEKWRRLIDSRPKESKDQKALRTMWNHTLMSRESSTQSLLDCEVVAMEQKPHLDFSNAASMKTALKTHKYPTLNHIKNTQHAKDVDGDLQRRFIARLLKLNASETKLAVSTKMVF